MKSVRQSVLLKTSSNADVQTKGGSILITGLPDVQKKNIVAAYQIKYRAAVAQVVTIGSTAYTPTASTKYSVAVYDPNRFKDGYSEGQKVYTFITASNLLVNGANAAAQREAIHAGLVAKINADQSNNATAVSLGSGNGFTVTDRLDYYPVKSQSMTNEKFVNTVIPITNPDGTGFAENNFVITTPGVVSFGVGAKLATEAPIMDFMYGNLISGTIDAAPATPTNPPTYATSGQNYDGFIIVSLKDIVVANLTGQIVYVPREQYVFVDNGSGSSTSNLAGFLTFERDFRKIIAQTYSQDANAVIQWFDQGFLEQAPLGAVPSGTAAASNTFLTPYGSLTHYQIGTQTIVTGAQGANGFLMEQDATATEGAAYFPLVTTPNSQQFIVGKTPITVNCKASFTTPANIVFMVGLRAKEAPVAAFANYTKLATIGTGSAGTFFTTYGALAAASTVTTISAVSAVTTVSYDFRIQVAIDGTVTAFANNVSFPIYSVGTTPLVFAAGTVLVPHMQYTNLNSSAAVPTVSEFWAVASDLVIS